MQDTFADALASPLSHHLPPAAVATATPAGPLDPPRVLKENLEHLKATPIFDPPAHRPPADPPKAVAAPAPTYADRWVIWPGNEHLDLLERRWSNGAVEYPNYRATARPSTRMRFGSPARACAGGGCR